MSLFLLQFCPRSSQRCPQPDLHTTHSLVQRAGVAGDEGGRRHRDPQSHHWYRRLCEGEHSHVLPSQLVDVHSFFDVGRIPDSLRNCVNKEFFVTTAPWGMMEQQHPQVHPELNGATYRWEGEHPF